MQANSISKTSFSQTLAAHGYFSSVQIESFQGPQTQFIMRWSWRLKSLITLITFLSKEKHFASGYILNLFGTNVALKGCFFFFSADEAFRCGAANFTSPLKAVSQEVYCIRSNFISAGCFKLDGRTISTFLNSVSSDRFSTVCCITVTTGHPELLSLVLSPRHDYMSNRALKR